MLSLIAAIGLRKELGINGKMPWHLPEDLKYFKEITKGHTIIMGKTTFYSLPKILPGRKHIVLTRDKNFNPEHPMVERAESFERVISACNAVSEEIFIIGGAQIYAQSIAYCSKLYITLIHESFDADTYFPAIDEKLYNSITKSEIQTSALNGLKYQFLVYEK